MAVAVGQAGQIILHNMQLLLVMVVMELHRQIQHLVVVEAE
jgi:hypothetical protein